MARWWRRRRWPEGKSVREVVLELGLMEADELDAALDAHAMTEGGIRS